MNLYNEHKLFAKILGYDFSIYKCKVKNKETIFSLYSKVEIKYVNIIDDVFIIDNEWYKANTQYCLTNNSFFPSEDSSLILCHKELLKTGSYLFNREDDFIEVTYMIEDQEFTGHGEIEREAQYEAIKKYTLWKY